MANEQKTEPTPKPETTTPIPENAQAKNVKLTDLEDKGEAKGGVRENVLGLVANAYEVESPENYEGQQ